MKHSKRVLGKMLVSAAVLCAAIAVAPDAVADPRTHDGFYLQIDAGLGYFSTSAEIGQSEVTYSGVTLPSSLLIGGSPMPGLVIGGGLLSDFAPSPSAKYKLGGASGETELDDVNVYVIGIGPFVDFYLDPHQGLHFQGLIGFGGLEASYKGDAGGSDPTGVLLSVGVGHDWWVGDEWSIGVLGRFTYGAFSRDDVSFPTISPAVLASFTYH